MDDLAGKLSELLNDPQSLEKIKGLSGLLSQVSSAQPKLEKPPAQETALLDTAGISADTMQMVLKLAPLFSSLKQEDDSTRLLHALRPLLKEPRRKRLDESIKILQIIRLLPMLKNSGLL